MTCKCGLLFYLMFFGAFYSFSQDDTWKEFNEELQKEGLKVREVKKALEKLKMFYDLTEEQESDCDYNGGLERKLYPKYKEYEYYFCRKMDSICCGLYHVKFYSYRNKVIYLRLKNAEDPGTELLITTNKYADLISYHSKRMDINPDTTHEYFSPIENAVVSFGCYYDGGWFYQMKKIDSLVSEENREEIIKWCHSLSSEIRCHGAIGLIWLFEKGVVLSNEEKRLLKYIYYEKTIITICGGCTGFTWESINEFLKNEMETSTLKKLKLN